MKLVRNVAGRPPAIVKPTHVHTHNSSTIILNLYISVAWINSINSINLCLYVFVYVHTYGHHIDQITVVCMLYWIVRAIIFYIQCKWSRHFLVLVYMYIGCSEERLYHAWWMYCSKDWYTTYQLVLQVDVPGIQGAATLTFCECVCVCVSERVCERVNVVLQYVFVNNDATENRDFPSHLINSISNALTNSGTQLTV